MKKVSVPSGRDEAARVVSQMKFSGLLLWATGCLRMYKDGDGFGVVFRAWHPATWVAAVVMVIPCAVFGERLGTVVPVRLSQFWLRNRAQLQWVQPWTRLATLRPFNHAKAVRDPLERG